MKTSEIKPNISFADKLEYTVSGENTKTYDCRMLYIISGNGSIDIEDKKILVRHGILIMFQPGTKYRLNPQNSFSVLVVDFDLTDEYADEKNIKLLMTLEKFDIKYSHKVINFTDCEELNSPIIMENLFSIEDNLYSLINEFNSVNCFKNEIASSLMRVIIFKVLTVCKTDRNLSNIVELVIDYIHKNYNKRIKNIEIARFLNYEPCYLNRIFAMSVGMTLHQYIIKYRVNEALKYLLRTDLSIERIAELTGFYNTAHFSAIFKRSMGNSSSVYRVKK